MGICIAGLDTGNTIVTAFTLRIGISYGEVIHFKGDNSVKMVLNSLLKRDPPFKEREQILSFQGTLFEKELGTQ